MGQGGDVVVPPDAEVIDATGKTVLPGFVDGHGHLEDFHGELYLHFGITTCVTIEIFQDGPWGMAQREGTALGKINGPRILTSGPCGRRQPAPRRIRPAGVRYAAISS